ncbi:hypothetical protein Hypma_014108 [Hypsizygus marmoreus]|uniref:Uncharacterized protein n=1 Tax=Hypsizygus marmoreus TaxID=39966 RepID=A0A369K8N1_HYPMA|nr:hypothetical protein Hypma_014108 [Hypsizygus marmoreus]
MSPPHHSDPAVHPLKDLHVAQWPRIKVLLVPRTEGWRPSLHYDLPGYVEVDAVPVSGTLPGVSRPIHVYHHSVELDFRFWQKCPSRERGLERRDIGGSGSPRLYSPETFIKFYPPHTIPAQNGQPVKMRYPFCARVPCTEFHKTTYGADRFFECTARAWYWPDFIPPETQPNAAAPTSIAGPLSTTSRAYMPPHALSHTLHYQDLPEPAHKPPSTYVPFYRCRNLR